MNSDRHPGPCDRNDEKGEGRTSPEAMNGECLQRKVTITNPQGFHMRPQAAFAKLASCSPCSVRVRKDEKQVNGKSLLELMLLAAEQGAELIVEVVGPDARQTLDALVAILAAPEPEELP